MNLFARLQWKFKTTRLEGELRAAFAEGHTDVALALARTLYDMDRGSAWANFLIACEHLEADRYREALRHLTPVLEDWPEEARVWYAVGVCEDRLERPEAAVRAYRRALLLVPDWSELLKNIGRDLYLLGDYSGSEQALRRFCEASPDIGEVQDSNTVRDLKTSRDLKEAHDLLGYVCYRQGKFMLAFGHYERARRLDPLNPKLERNARLLYGRSATS